MWIKRLGLKKITLSALVAALLSISGYSSAKEGPVAKMIQVTGAVEYSRDGSSWRELTRPKYLFAGYQIKTGSDGAGTIIMQANGLSQDLGPDSEIQIGDSGIELVSGDISDPVENAGSIFEGLSNKFAKAQRYTTVRRSVGKPEDTSCDSKVRTIREVTLSAAHPDLVWRNACPEHSYRLVIDGTGYDVPAQSTSEMIRFTVTDMTPGEHSYHVEVLDKDGTVYIPRSDSSFTWLDASAEAKVMAELEKIDNDAFLAANLLEQNNMYVAAMDKYRAYFAEYTDDNDMRPLLIQSYQELKLSNLRESEARLYNALNEEG